MSKKKKKKTKKKAPSLKTRAEMTDAEYTDLLERSCVRLYEYLCSVADRDMSDQSRDIVARVISEEFRYRMATDEVFFNKINRFMHSKAVSDSVERALFFLDIVRDICSSGKIRETIADRYPDTYRLPEQRPRKVHKFRALSEKHY